MVLASAGTENKSDTRKSSVVEIKRSGFIQVESFSGGGTIINMTTAHYKKVRKLSIAERAYLGGIIDGEGSVTLTVKQKGGTRHLTLLVSNTDLPLLCYLRKIIGAGKIISQRTYKSHHRPVYKYSISNRQALSVLEQIRPYLRTYKLKRAKIVLKYYLLMTPRNGKYNDNLRKKREKFVQRFFAVAS
ncbi:MAG: LAGLIDADG family homing endonuclease [Candidatus Sungbacteria bacterium]|nr:LAGLIDADG family homing endonuclease [Candidatus Sungbacteria bacterium]